MCLLSVKLVYVYVKFLKIKSANKKGIFVITEKPRVIFAKCIWRRIISKYKKGGFGKHVFIILFLVKKYIFIQKLH
jgi:hypothetical protein